MLLQAFSPILKYAILYYKYCTETYKIPHHYKHSMSVSLLHKNKGSQQQPFHFIIQLKQENKHFSHFLKDCNAKMNAISRLDYKTLSNMNKYIATTPKPYKYFINSNICWAKSSCSIWHVSEEKYETSETTQTTA